MFNKFFLSFRNLPLSNKSMVYLMWIYTVGSIISGVFINIYVFKLNSSIQEAFIFNIIYFTSTFLGFFGGGLVMSGLGKDIKNMYYVSYFLFIASFIEIFIFKGTLLGAYAFGLLYAFGNGAFWNAVHTQELKNIKEENRDFYSSSISAGNGIVSVLTPLFVALVFYIARLVSADGYMVLFLFLPLVYAISFFFIKNINSYIPPKVCKQDFVNFFNLKKYKFGHLYFFLGGFIYSLTFVGIPTISIILLENETKIGIFQGVLTFFAAILVVLLSHTRNQGNRFRFFLIVSTLVFVNYIFFGLFFHLINFIVFSLIGLILTPIYRVSEHVYDLTLMDNIKTENSDFYPAMIMRECVLWLGRIVALSSLLWFAKFTNLSVEAILKIVLILIGTGTLLLSGIMYLWEKKERHVG